MYMLYLASLGAWAPWARVLCTEVHSIGGTTYLSPLHEPPIPAFTTSMEVLPPLRTQIRSLATTTAAVAEPLPALHWLSFLPSYPTPNRLRRLLTPTTSHLFFFFSFLLSAPLPPLSPSLRQPFDSTPPLPPFEYDS